MRKILIVSCLVSLLFSFTCDLCCSADHSNSSNPADILLISGVITDTHGKGVMGVNLSFFLNGRKVAEQEKIFTSHDGAYEAKIFFPPNTLA